MFPSIKECMKQLNNLKPEQKVMSLQDNMNKLKDLYYTNKPNNIIKEKVDVLRNFKKIYSIISSIKSHTKTSIDQSIKLLINIANDKSIKSLINNLYN